VKILFVGVFDAVGKSTNTSQLMAFKSLGHDVVGYNYRQKALAIGPIARDEHLCSLVEERNFDLVVFSKCNLLPLLVFEKITKKTKTCLWFMDPLSTLQQHPELLEASSMVDYFCCDKKKVLNEVVKINKNSFHVCEGYDQAVEYPREIQKEYDVSFIGNLYGHRRELIDRVVSPVKVISNAFGPEHSINVGKSKINLNFCTDFGASDRVYKIMAAGGFLLSDDWEGRVENFVDNEHLVIYRDIEELNEKISYFLNNSEERQEIARKGLQGVKKFDRISWAKNIIDLSHAVAGK